MGKLFFHDLEILCIVGIHPHERSNPQPIFLDVEIEYDFSKAAKSDDIRDAVDYEPLVQRLTTFIQEEQFQLIERLAQRSAELVFECFPIASAVLLRVRKPGALPTAKHSGVEVRLSRAPQVE